MTSGNHTFVIAEAGVNHNGSLDLALRLVDAAADARADAVKFQTFRAERLATEAAAKADYQMAATGSGESQRDMLRRLELSESDHHALVARCRERGIEFLSSAFDLESLAFLKTLDVSRVKVPSGELTNLPYLRHVAAFGLPILLSTGMATLDEVEEALRALEQAGAPRERVTVLHCTTEYPAPLADVNLRAMTAIRDTLGVRVGYSDHTEGHEVAVAAVALGATVVEKHFTLDRSMEGPDHRASLEPDELRTMVSAIRRIETALGDSAKRPSSTEERTSAVARKSLVAAKTIRAGEPFTEDNIVAKRPGTGISPMRWDEVIGRTAPRDFGPDDLIEL